MQVFINGELFKKYGTVSELIADVVEFFKFVTPYREQTTPNFLTFLTDVKALNEANVNCFNNKPYTVKIQLQAGG